MGPKKQKSISSLSKPRESRQRARSRSSNQLGKLRSQSSASVLSQSSRQRSKSQARKSKRKLPSSRRKRTRRGKRRKTQAASRSKAVSFPGPVEDGESWQLKSGASASRNSAKQKQPPSIKDLFFIITLWTLETVKIALDTFRVRYTRDLFQAKREWMLAREHNITSLIEDAFVATGAAVVPLVAVALGLVVIVVTTVKPKLAYWILLFGLMGFSANALLGYILAMTKKDEGIAYAMMLVTALWYVVHPLRFLLIFHQFIPMRSIHSHMLVAGNLIFLWVIEYLFHETVIRAAEFDPDSIVPWIVALFLAIAWLGGTFVVNRWRNRVPMSEDDVREKYKGTEALPQFDRRQKLTCYLSLWIIVCPWAVFTVMKTAMVFGFNEMSSKFSPQLFEIPRIDIAASICVTVIFEIFHMIRRFRSEIFDMIVINLMFLMSIPLLILVRDLQLEQLNATPLGPVGSWKNEPGYCKLVLVVVEDRKSLAYVIDGKLYADPAPNPMGLMAKVPLSEPAKVTVKIILASGKVLAESELELHPNKKLLFRVRIKKQTWTLVSGLDEIVDEEIQPQILVMNTWEQCDHSKYTPEAMDWQMKVEPIPGGIGETQGFNLPQCATCAPFRFEYIDQGTKESLLFVRMPEQVDAAVRVLVPLSAGSSMREVLLKYHNAEYLKFENRRHGLSDVWDYSLIYPRILERQTVYVLITQPKPAMSSCFSLKFEKMMTTNTTLVWPSTEVRPEQAMLGAIYSMAAVSYIHLMWIMCPVMWRVPIIYTFFMVEMIADWATRIFLKEFTTAVVFALMAFFTVGFVCHNVGVCLYFFTVHLKKSRQEREAHIKRY